jgi:hypothetical protein
VPCSFIKIDHCFRGAYCLHLPVTFIQVHILSSESCSQADIIIINAQYTVWYIDRLLEDQIVIQDNNEMGISHIIVMLIKGCRVVRSFYLQLFHHLIIKPTDSWVQCVIP